MMINSVLSILFYIFGIATFIVLIILGIRIIQLLNNAERVLSNVEDKVNSLNSLFNVINKATTSIDLISSRIVGSIIGVIEKIFKRKKEENDDE